MLDNDFSPAGDQLTLVANVAGETAGELGVQPPGEQRIPTGDAYVAGRFVRYVAPPRIDDAETFSVRYLASNAAGETTPGDLQVTVVPGDRRNQPPEPPGLEGRAVAGDTLKLKVPGVDVDPDGDPVTLTGITTAPKLGRIIRLGANSLQYQAYPGSVGTDEFGYTVTDQLGAPASGTVRVAIVPPGTPQPPLAVPDTVTVEAGRTARVEALANDLIAAGDRVSIELVDPPAGVELASPQGPVLIDAPAERRAGPQRRGRLPDQQRARHVAGGDHGAHDHAVQQPARGLRRVRRGRRRATRSPSTCWRRRTTPTARPRTCGSRRCRPRPTSSRRSTAARSRSRAATSRGSTRSGSSTATAAPRPHRSTCRRSTPARRT